MDERIRTPLKDVSAPELAAVGRMLDGTGIEPDQLAVGTEAQRVRPHRPVHRWGPR